MYTTDNKFEYTAHVFVCVYPRNRVNILQSRVANQFVSYYIHHLSPVIIQT